MKKLFSLLTLALLTMSAWAQTTVTFTAGTDVGLTEANNSADTISKDGVTIICTDAAFATAQYRFYAGSTTTITSTVGNITKVEFTCTGSGTANNGPSFFSTETGNYSYAGNVGTWTGDAATLTLAASKQVRATQIVITIGGEVVETVAAPTLPAAQNFDDSFVVEITNIAEGATAMYSTDNLTWQTYSSPFTITETTTVYAKAVKGEIESEVVHAKYTKNTPVTGTCITFNYADDEAITSAQAYTVERPGASFTVSNGMINGHYRIYKNQTITFTSTAGNIIRIEFDGLSGNPASNFGEVEGMSYDGNNGTWVGSAETVTFTASLNQVRCTEIRVYVDGELPSDFVAAPSIPASQNFDESITVEITNNAEGATVMYNTDGETWTAYTGALTFTETTTLQAKAVKGENESSVVEATYTKNEPAEDITTLAQVNALNDNTEFEFKGDAVVTAQAGQYLWLRDATGYGLIYGTIEGTFTNGQVLSQNWTAKKTTFRGLTEYTNAANVSASGVTNTALAAAQVITALSEDMVNAYVLVKNVTSFTVSGKNVTANFEDGTTMVMYNQFNVEVPTTEGNYTVEGAVGKYNENLQLYILSIEGYTPEEHDVNSIAEAYALPENATFTMFDEMVVTYQKGNRLWIRDTEGTSGMIYGDLGATFENGQVLTDGWSATYAIYNNVPEFTNPVDVEADGDNTRDASPYERTTITNDNVNEYVILKGISLLADTTNAKRFYNAADSLVIFNSFNVEIPEVDESKTYDVTGIVTIYYGKPQIYITEMTEVAAAGKRGDVNLDNAVNIADVTALIDYLLSGDDTGISLENANCNQDAAVNIADVTALIDYLLSGAW
ncbi:MAG: chitobiase/beta-hexosaminidase C-terminal domain-containing protein [Muribaculaceae bacterium]|nr:chitobiase/beta-hexosaminidase C-terminal domain-containing protein [Muribaculaceae bacterium]